ncbi:hypothetical protein [Allomesorhizobium camelthorni]|uniref:Antitoxin Xre/MbcA/ParS-like middle domain-containing protein n=1 Tax=Allomesorhizobium camelthorni TaxID=475069 RepID=A0A6G4WKD4_9HYPH|nr:hypothetical protein [Mesorhizobium camelthorni]NGO54547.1 hypothetical protein [Mesorhizobium camelthorni]
MTGSSDLGNEIPAELSSSVLKELQRVLVHYNKAARERSSISSCIEAKETAVTRPLPPADELTALAFEFVHRFAAEAARRLDVNAREAASSTVQAADAPGSVVPEAQNHQRDGMRIEDWAGQIAGPTHLEKHFGIPRSTLHWWQRHNDVIALRKGARKHVFPLAQFIDGRPTPGIRQVLASISNPRLAWMWLIRPSPLLNSRVPIEMLRKDLTEEVASAARAFSLIAPS